MFFNKYIVIKEIILKKYISIRKFCSLLLLGFLWAVKGRDKYLARNNINAFFQDFQWLLSGLKQASRTPNNAQTVKTAKSVQKSEFSLN